MPTRDAHDRYYTPDWACQAIVRRLAVRGYLLPDMVVWEPHVGEGRIIDALQEFVPGPRNLWGSDLFLPDGLEHRFEADHDAAKGPPEGCEPDLVIGNPPFKLAEAHLRVFLELPSKPVVAVLLRMGFLESQKRSMFWAQYPVHEVHVFQTRPSFVEGGGGTDSFSYGLFIWRPGPIVGQVLDWIGDRPPR